jgi:hypothetical protein
VKRVNLNRNSWIYPTPLPSSLGYLKRSYSQWRTLRTTLSKKEMQK